jgi:hypothetical protein
MADYAKMLRDGVKLIKETTLSLQPVVTLHQWVAQDLYGKPLYAVITLQAITVQAPNMHKTSNGQLVAVQAYVAFLEPVPPNGTAGRLEPIDPRDKIVLPDGSWGPIVEVKGFIDAGTGKPMFSEVWIGSGGTGGLDS